MEPNLTFEHQRDIDYKNLPQSIKDLVAIPQYEQRSSEWFDARKRVMTASVIDSILGRNKYQTRTEVLFKKCGISTPFTGNKFTEHGCLYEDEAIAEYCRIFNKKTIDFGLLPHPTIDFIAGSPDGIAFDNGDPECEPIVLEVKCPYSRKIIPGVVPEHYLSQLKLNMEITGFNGAFIEYIPQGHLGNNKFLNIIHMTHDPHWLPEVLPELREFWNEVLHYRDNGINTHKDHDKYYRKAYPKKKKSITIDSTPRKSMFLD